MRSFIVLIGGLLCWAGIAVAQELVIPADQDVISFETKLGVVTFQHKKHAELSQTECSTCHHKLQPEDTSVKACHACHGADVADAPKVKTAFHTTCIGCHEYTVKQGEEAGPLKKKCKLCHVK